MFSHCNRRCVELENRSLVSSSGALQEEIGECWTNDELVHSGYYSIEERFLLFHIFYPV